MTQALLNSLNIIKETGCNLKEKSYTDVGNDFAKILDMANSKAANNSKSQKSEEKETSLNQKNTVVITDKNSQISDKEDTKSINTDTQKKLTDTNTEVKDTEKREITDNSDSKENVTADSKEEDAKAELNTDTQNEQSIQNIILEAAIETIVAECLVGKSDADNSDMADTAENTDDADVQETNEEQNAITENTITEEAPTMYKELNTLENPTAALILQTQIKTSTKHVVQDNEVQSQKTIKEQENSLKNAELNSNLKSFEDDMSKLSGMNAVPKTDASEKTEVAKIKVLLNEKVVKDLNVQNVQSEGTNTGAEGESFTQSPQEQVVKVMIQGDLKVDTAYEAVAKSTVLKPEAANPSKIIEQISKQLENMGHGSKLTMVLNPESLGKINIQLLTTKTGLTAQLTVTTAEARDILMKGLEGLKENLLSQGISIDNVSIKLEETASEENTFDWTEQEGSRGGNKQQESRRQKDEEKQQFEQLMFEYNNGNV